MNTCDFTPVPCPKKCKQNNAIQMILRKDLEKHLTEQCVNRHTVNSAKSDEIQEFFKEIEKHIKRSGSIDRLLAHLVFVGLPGSGKSTLIARLLKLRPQIEKLLKASPSTGVMNGIIAVDVVDDKASMHAANIGNSDDWNTVEFGISCLRQMGVKCFVTFEDGESVGDSQRPSKSSTNGSGSSRRDSLPPSTLANVRKILKKEGKFTSIRPFLENRISLYLSDTGGQIEFQELLPLLVAGLAIFVFLFPLNVNLSDFFRICYRKEDGSEDNCYTSSLTIREALLQTLSSIDAMRTDTSIAKHKPYVFIAGTHKDCLIKEVCGPAVVQDEATAVDLEDEVKKEAVVNRKIAEIDDEIKSLIKEHKYDDLVVYANPDKKQAIFTIDNTRDSEVFGDIRSRILQFIRSREEFRIQFPLSYLLASLELQDSSQPFLQRKEFTEAISQYGISEAEVDHLLQFLHSRIGQIRYFPTKGLKDVIVKEPQALFNLVTDLIVNSFKRGGTMADHLEVQKGIYTFKEFHFESHVSNLTPKEVIELLKELRIVAPFHDRQAKVEKYFIPCVLNHLSESTLEEKQTDIQSLAFMFECGHCPKGTFGVLVHYILIHEEEGKINWNLDIDKICRDQVSFQFGIYEDIITLKFLTTHLEVRCCPDSISRRSAAFSKKAVCNRVRVVLQDGIKQVTKSLHYDEKKMKHSLGLLCEKCARIHQVVKDDDRYVLKCPDGSYPLPDCGLYWFGLSKYSVDGSIALECSYLMYLIAGPPVSSLPNEVRVKEGFDQDVQWMVSCEPPLRDHSQHSLFREDGQPFRQDNIFIQGNDICFRKVKRRDAGKYVISSSNAIGKGHASFNLQVQCELHHSNSLISVHSLSSSLHAGLPEYTLESDYIEAAAGTTPTVRFSVCPPLDEGIRHTLTKEGGRAATKRFKVEDDIIIFWRVTETDEGRYSISCENDVGVGQATLELMVNSSTIMTACSPKAGE